MRESASDRTSRYLDSTTAALKRLKVKKLPSTVSESNLSQVLDLVQGYTKDARYYSEKRRPVTSLACVAYAEGLLDAMKFLELVDF